MSLLFWRKTTDIAPQGAQAVVVTTDDPLPVQIINNDETPQVEVVKSTPSYQRPLGMQNGLSIGASAVYLTLPSRGQVNRASVQVFTAPIRFTLDGTTPTATVGHRADVYDQIELEGYHEVAGFRAIREGATSATVEVTYYEDGVWA